VTDPRALFDIDAPELPPAIKAAALGSGGFPYGDELKKAQYEDQVYALQKQLVRLQAHMIASGERIIIVFEGRDAAGKGGAIETYRENLNPRYNVTVALPKPNDREATQWYFQRYVDWLPAASETILFDRSWYNRAVVERVMGFCTIPESDKFLADAPHFEAMVTGDGIHLFKFWLDIGLEMQMQRFHDRRHDPLKTWKLSPVDEVALQRWDDYSAARDLMLSTTDSAHAPWSVVLANDKRRARLNIIRTVLGAMSFQGKDEAEIGPVDPAIVLGAEAFLARRQRD